MCGLAGWVDYTRKLDDEFPAIFAMTDTLALRGPDAEGIWKHRNALLGHRRLAVIDLSGGVQPMSYRFPHRPGGHPRLHRRDVQPRCPARAVAPGRT